MIIYQRAIIFQTVTLTRQINLLRTQQGKSVCSLKMAKSKPTILLTRNDFPEDGVKLLKEHFDLEVADSNTGISKEQLTSALKGKFGVFCWSGDKFDSDTLKNATDLKVIGTFSVGYDHLNLADIKAKGIRVGYTPNVLTESVAVTAIGLLLATSRRIVESNKVILRGGWNSWTPSFMCGPDLQGSTVGIIGCGRIGISVLEKLVPFKVAKFLYTSRSSKPEAEKLDAVHTDVDDLVKQSDFIIITSALTPETHHLINKSRLNSMKPTAIIINVSRGQLIDQEALIDALQNSRIGGAGLDVMYPEPLPLDNPLLKLDNCVITPHIGSAQNETRQAMSRVSAENIISVFQDKPMTYELPL